MQSDGISEWLSGSESRMRGPVSHRLQRELFILFVALPAIVVDAQTDTAARVAAHHASLVGSVVDRAAGAPVAGADVWLPSQDKHASTDSTGRFRFVRLSPDRNSFRSAVSVLLSCTTRSL